MDVMKQIIMLLITMMPANLRFEVITMDASYRSEETLATIATNDKK